jgi:hypothetical protein
MEEERISNATMEHDYDQQPRKDDVEEVKCTVKMPDAQNL